MCGIAGFVDKQLPKQEAEHLLESMLETISHRGPDARGKWIQDFVALGHNRLSIIDLTVDGNQPMESEDAIITFNGEIYNYIEVRQELIQKGFSFKTQSDTEVILAAYKAYGTDCVQHFVGMWAFAIWDKRKEILFCSRDRFGIKPFYFIQEKDQFYFASEYKPLKKSSLFKGDLNALQISRGLQLGWVCYGEETYFNEIKALPAAHNLIFSKDGIQIIRYWDIDLNKRFEGNNQAKQAKFLELFSESIRLHMRSDVEVGACLSGGLDSSAIVSMIARMFPESRFKTFTVFYEGKDAVDERPFVREVLKKYPSLNSFEISPSENLLREEFEKAVHHADVPITGSSPLSQYFLMQLAAKQGIKVVIDGQGADEFLAGYMHSFYRLIGGLITKLDLINAHKEFYGHIGNQDFGLVKSADVFLKSILTGSLSEQSLYDYEYKNYFPFLSKETAQAFDLKAHPFSRLNTFLYNLTFSTLLPTLLHFEDRNSMAFSIESRVPFLDHRLVEFVFSLKDEDKIQRGVTKKIMRDSLQEVLPKAISDRKDKKGFVTPGEVKWLRGPLKHLIDAPLKPMEFLHRQRATKVISEFKKGNNEQANLVWRLAVLNYWLP